MESPHIWIITYLDGTSERIEAFVEWPNPQLIVFLWKGLPILILNAREILHIRRSAR